MLVSAKPTADPVPLPTIYGDTHETAEGPAGLSGHIDCDTLVVGGGVTGLAGARALAARGRDVVILEAKVIGAGGSGRAFGQVVAFGKQSEAALIRTHGRDRGERLIAWLATGPERVFDLIARHDMRCQAHRTGLLFAAHHEKAVRPLRARAVDLARRGYDVRFLERDETAEAIGGDLYPGAMLDRRAGSIDPLAYAQGLAAAAVAAGARIFRNTPVRTLLKDGEHWRAETPSGSVRAASVVIATNAYTPADLWPGLAESIVPTRAYQLVSAPLGENLRNSILPGRQALTDTRRLFSAVRLLDDGRLHATTYGRPFALSAEPDPTFATDRVLSLFPQLGSVDWESGWSGWVAVNTAQAPRLHALADGVWSAAGYSGRGLALGTLIGEQIALRIADPQSADIVYPVSPLKPLPGQRFGPLIVGAYFKLASVLDARELRQTRARAVASRRR